MTCVEIDAELAQEARRNLKNHANVRVEHGRMEDWTIRNPSPSPILTRR